jgi:hypothetical protein
MDLGEETKEEKGKKVLCTMISQMKAADGKNVYYFNGPSQQFRAFTHMTETKTQFR